MTEDLYKIGAVAKRTGITPECLRAWERRYGLHPAERVGKTRFYSASQVDRLLAMKALLDQGHAISDVVRWGESELARRLHGHRPRSARPAQHQGAGPRVGLVGGPLVKAYREAETPHANVQAQWVTLEAVQAEEGALPTLDALFLYLPSLLAEPIDLLRSLLPDARIAVAYRYTSEQDRVQLQAAGVPLLRWPAPWDAVEDALAAMSFEPEPAAEGRMYSDEALDHIDQMTGRAPCECPRHLAELISAINALTAHGDNCRGTDDHQPIQAHLRRGRAEVEQALRQLVERHGLLETPN